MLRNNQIVRVIEVPLKDGEVLRYEVIETMPKPKEKGSNVVGLMFIAPPVFMFIIECITRYV